MRGFHLLRVASLVHRSCQLNSCCCAKLPVLLLLGEWAAGGDAVPSGEGAWAAGQKAMVFREELNHLATS